jgi:5-methylcytosine-specific restriction endonuclease McrA
MPTKDSTPHGRSRYRQGCRCEVCKAATKMLYGGKCERCGTPYQTANRRQRYCSRECSGEARRDATRTMATCAHCGGTFRRSPSDIDPRRGRGVYCSMSCSTAARRRKVAVTCPICGTGYEVNAPRWARGQGRTCSKRCMGVAARRDHHNARNGWRYAAWRTDVFRRDNYTCRRCGQRGGNLDAHHVKPFAAFPTLRYDVANGLTLCEACHLAEHATHSPHLLSSARGHGHSPE